MKPFAFVLALVACGHADHPVAVRGQAPPSSGRPARVPAGWSEIDPPDDERRHCANYSEDEWQVSIAGDDLLLAAPKQHEADTGPAIAFEAAQREVRGRRHVVAVDDGYLVGYDGGEWDGALYWTSKDGAQKAELGKSNVRGLVLFDATSAVALEGLAHIVMDEGAARWLERTPSGWRVSRVTALPAMPRTFVAATDAIYAITGEDLLRITRDGEVAKIQPVSTERLYPDSMAIDGSGQLWIGMRQFVLGLTPRGAGYAAHWYGEDRCRKATVVGLDCRCEPM